MYESRAPDGGCEAAVSSRTDAHSSSRADTRSSVLERVSRYGMQVMVVPGAPLRRSRQQRQQEAAEGSAQGGGGGAERGSLTPAMRKKYLKDLLFSNPSSHSGWSSALSSQSRCAPSEQDADWALCPMEHAWMLSAVEGNYETIMDFISEDPYLLSRRDFISGYSVLHWLAKRGQDESLIKVLRHAESAGIPVNVDLRGSGGLTPLHVASMHGQYMVVKLLVGAFGANVDAMDYSGRRAWQYLRGDAPLEMRELLGTWDNEHSSASVNKNNSGTGAGHVTCGDEVDAAGEDAEEESYFDRTRRAGSWRFGSVRKMLSSLSFRGNKS